MGMRYFYWVICIFAVCNILNAADKELSTNDKRQIERYKALAKEARQLSQTSEIDINGKVVDEQGNALNDVSLEIRFSRSLVPFGKSEDIHEQKTINGSFEINKKFYTYVEFSFHKKGHYSEKFYYGMNNNQNPTNKIEKHNLEVVLREIGKEASLKNKRSYFDYNIKEETQSIFNLHNFKFERSLDANKLSNSKETGFFKLILSKDEKGNVIKNKKANQMGIYEPTSVHLQLVSDNDKDGIIVVKSVHDISYLQEAPLEGYETKIIPCEIGSSGNMVYFYYRYGNYYGKGYIDAANISGSDSVNAPLTLFQNTVSRDRNLRSRDRR